MADEPLIEIRDLLVEIRDLLLPVADAHQDSYDERLAAREEQRIADVRDLLSTEKRTKAWALADGTRTQSEIARQSSMTKGNASTFFKSLRDLGALSKSSNPEKTIEVQR